MVSNRTKTSKALILGVAFILPNILGFFIFTLTPLLISVWRSFTNWNFRLHNQFRAARDVSEGLETAPINFIGLGNFVRLFREPDFYHFLGNTFFMMMTMPFAMGASLIVAIMLSKDLGGGSNRSRVMMICSAVLIAGVLMLTMAGAGATAMTMLLGGLIGSILIAGTAVGSTLYRTLFYVPSFASGVATMILWKKLYNPQSGPINMGLAGPLESLQNFVRSKDPAVIQSGFWLLLAIACVVIVWGFIKLRKAWVDGDFGTQGVVIGSLLLLLPTFLASAKGWIPVTAQFILIGVSVGAIASQIAVASLSDLQFKAKDSAEGIGSAMLGSAGMMVLQFLFIGLGLAIYVLPEKAAAGTIEPPNWLSGQGAIYWAKPSLMLMGLWAAVGSNTMLLYLAALTNVPGELYEAADIDGATPLQKFWNVTWPQLAPTTFFNVVMGVIGGLQGGFESARVMTNGGPAGATKTLAFYIYSEGFDTGRLGYGAAVAWTLFILMFAVTLFNWKFGNKYVND